MDAYLAVDREHAENCDIQDADAEWLDTERSILADDIIDAVEHGHPGAQEKVFCILCEYFDSFSEQDIENCRKAVGVPA